jgi:hypothetical protein
MEEEARNHLIWSALKARQQRPCKSKNNTANTFNFGLGSSIMSGTGIFLHLFDKDHKERGGSVLNVMHKSACHGFDKEANVAVSSLVRKLESFYLGKIVDDTNLERYCSFPSPIDIWQLAALISAMGKKGIAVLPPFLGCLAYSSSSMGIGNSSEPHFDQKIATVVSGAYCDAHAPLTASSHVVFIVHTSDGKGGIISNVIPQSRDVITFFHGNECWHLASDAYTWYDTTIGKSSLPPVCKEQVHSLIMGNEQTFAEIQSERVWISVYCKASMYDLAWELHNYEASSTKPQTHEIVREKCGASQLGNSTTGSGQLQISRAKRRPIKLTTIKEIQKKHGHSNPYSQQYK